MIRSLLNLPFRPFYSLEFFPPKTPIGRKSLINTLKELVEFEPLFVDMTWGAGGSVSVTSLKFAKICQKYFGLNTILHLTCVESTRKEILEILKRATKSGIKNILALKGDGDPNEFNYAEDLIKFIRMYSGQFGIVCAGYPEKHPISESIESDIYYLKRKVDSGADMIITQMFFDNKKYFNFVKNCRKAGITIPIIPGLLTITNYQGLMRMLKITNVKLPEELKISLEKANSIGTEAVKELGIKWALKQYKGLLEGGVLGLHLFCLNKIEPVKTILKELGLLTNCKIRKSLPWRGLRLNEKIRPVHFLGRMTSYIKRTKNWNNFPSNKWFKEEFHNCKLDEDINFPLISSEKEIIKIMNSLKKNPWSSSSSSNYDFTILNIPKINGEPSENHWGGSNGLIYSKEYIEFFITKEKLDILINNLDKNFEYLATNTNGTIQLSSTRNIQTVIWGVFHEIKQPVLLIPDIFFNEWRIEAFQMWIFWRDFHEENSIGWKILNNFHKNLFLCSLINHSFT